MPANQPTRSEMIQKARQLIEQKRSTCLWFLKSDYQPKDIAGYLRALKSIERHGQLADYQQARKIREWLLRDSKATSSAS